MVNDPIVEEVRKVRKAIEAACDNDPLKYAERLRQVELKYADRLVRRGPKPALPIPAVAEGTVTYSKPVNKGTEKGWEWCPRKTPNTRNEDNLPSFARASPELPSEGWCFVGNARVLDLCCGMGGLSAAAREMGMRVVAGGGRQSQRTADV